jgi:hypothetical protein
MGGALKQMERREAIFDRERDQKKGMRTYETKQK